MTASLALAAAVYLPFAILRRPTVLTAHASWSVVGLALICTRACPAD